jgi:phosphocarrier protein FPr/phosphocarrier protein
MSNTILVAPLAGWCGSLDEVPDPVFSGRVMGDGVAIDPTDAVLRAPCDGDVATVANARHAIVIRADSGAEILLHVGCNTVELGGKGFDVHVSAGQRVRTGDPLITFDLDSIAGRVPSLLTPIVVVEGKGFEVVRRENGRSIRAGEFLMEVKAAQPARPAETSSGPAIERRVRVPYEHGIHARPAALLVRALRGLEADVRAAARGRTIDARSAVGWMELGARRGEEVILAARGRDAAAALAALENALGAPSDPPRPLRPEDVQRNEASRREGMLHGVVASRGFAVGPAALIDSEAPEPPQTGRGPAREAADLDRARDVVRRDLERLRAASSGLASEVLEAHLSFIDDPELLRSAQDSIARGSSAGQAWRDAVGRSIEALRRTGDPRIAERADDLRDLERQVLRALAGQSPRLDPPSGSILVGEDLLLSQLVALPAGRIAGFCTAGGGPTSHVALLAAAMNVPALVAVDREVLDIAEGTPLVLDAEKGLLHVGPDAATLAAAEASMRSRREQRITAKSAAHLDCRLASGERIEVFANIGAAGDVAGALDQGAEGCGLLRTEFLFLDRDAPPGVEEQREAYQRIVSAFGGRPVVIRTLDAGSDKPLRYLPLPAADNPALGVRGIRAGLLYPQVLRDQLRAIVAVDPPPGILIPMVTSAEEIEGVRRIIDELSREIRRGVPRLGVMVETPAAALIAGSLAPLVDFFSIGTNDLAQYTLAIDRTQADLASKLDARHPAILRLIGATAEAAAGRPVAVCGGLASDPSAAPLLVGLGVRELSAVPSIIPEIKAVLRGVTLQQCRDLAREAGVRP